MPHLGIYSGTFDPIHIGHIAFADEAQRTCGLDRVVFMPEEHPRNKTNVTPIVARIAQAKTALRHTKHEVYRASHPRFTIAETLAELESHYPEAAFSFLIGADIVPSLASWPDIDQMLSRYQLIIGMRKGHMQTEVEVELAQLGASYAIVTTPHAHISSRQIRETLDPSTTTTSAYVI